MLVRLTDVWQEILHRRDQAGGYPAAVTELLGEMAAAATLMQANIKFNGSLIMQIMGDGPVKLAVAEVQPDLTLRATAKVTGEVAEGVPLSHLVNVNNQGRCAITLDPKDRLPGQQPYQGVVPLHGDRREKLEKLSEIIEHYMLQSEQLDTKLVLAANDKVAAGLLIQRLPLQGEANLAGSGVARSDEDHIGRNELDADTILHRLFWEEDVRRFEPLQGENGPRFACTCSRERVGNMLKSLGREEIESILQEQGGVSVDCDFCGARYQFDPVDAAQVFLQAVEQPPGSQQQH